MRALLLGLIAGVLSAQPPDAQTILARVRSAYTDLKSFQIDATNISETTNADFEQTFKTKASIASEQPGKFRVEAKGSSGITLVSDGSQVWTYNANLKQYTKTPANQDLSTALISGPPSTMFPESGGAKVKSAKLAGEENVAVEGTQHKCYMLEVQYEGPAKQPAQFWVDEATYLVLKRVQTQPFPNGNSMKTTTQVDTLKINQPLSAELFRFTPPADAKLVDSFQFPGAKKSSLLGKPAPEFKLSDLAGKEYTLSSLRGKVVMLDFWATWCAPCREEMPVLEKIHKDHPDVVLLGIDVGEDAEVVRKFVGENKVAYPILLAGRDGVSADYDAGSYPTVVVIGKDGTVQAHEVGYGRDSDGQLRAAIAQAAGSAAPAVLTNSAPAVISKVEPEYSEEARRAHISGTILVSVVVGTDGVARDIKVIRPLGSHLDEKAIEAVSKWRFKPGMRNGVVAAVPVTIEVSFRLLDNTPNEPRTAEEAYRRAVNLTRMQRLPEGIVLLDKAIALKPGWAEAYAARARAEHAQRRYTEAIDDFSEALRIDPKNDAWHNGRGLAYSYSGRHTRAIEDYNRAIELNPNGSAAYFMNRGWAYSESGNPATGIENLSRSIEMAPDNTQAYQYRAMAYAKLNNPAGAIADYTAAIELFPTRWLYERRADIRRSSGDAAGAEEDLRKGAELGGAALFAPKLIAPEDNAVFDVYPRKTVLKWEPSVGAVSYAVEWGYYSNGTWASPSGTIAAPGTTATFDFVGAQPGRWRVWPVNRDGQRGQASEWRTFRYVR